MDGFRFDVVRTPNVWIALADGTRLTARLWRPDTEEPVPAILEYLPYRKGDSMAARDESLGTWFAGHGFAYVRVDIRGTGDSDGVITDEYTRQEHHDALAVIAWLADTSWCSGAVGMVGISWGGFNSLQVAALRPPALKAVISICSTDDRYADDVHYKGGCLLACDALPWASVMLAYDALPPDPATVGGGWKESWLRRLDETPPFITTWLTHQRRDDYWEHGSICEDYGAIECPVYMVGGWADGYTNAIPRTLGGLPGICKGLIGPWPHSGPHVAAQGPRIDFLTEALRWWDRWLKGEPNGIEHEPVLRAWMQEPARAGELHLDRPGRWVSEPMWPAPSVSAQRFFLDSDGTLSGEPSDVAEIGHTGAQHHGLLAGVWCPYGPETDFPLDQRDEDALCLTFDTAPLNERLELLGYPRMRLTLAVDRPLAFVIARLCRVAPDESSTLISRGALNLAHRDGHEQPEPLESGRKYEVEIELDAVGQAVAAGDHLRLAISTTYWPWLRPSPDEVTLTLVTGESTWIDLPVRSLEPGDGPAPAYGPAQSAPRLPIDELEATASFRTIEHDGGVYTLSIDPEGDHRYRLPEGLEITEQARDRFTIREGDPLSARVECDRLLGLERGAWRVEVRTHSEMTAGREAFHLVDSVEAFDGADLVFERTWERSILRDLM
ncbi:MAG: CocE/NonD family hydrolase [Actinomycetota bacterium]